MLQPERKDFKLWEHYLHMLAMYLYSVVTKQGTDLHARSAVFELLRKGFAIVNMD